MVPTTLERPRWFPAEAEAQPIYRQYNLQMEPTAVTPTAPDWLADVVLDVADFPQPGIVFKDLGPLWGSSSALSRCAIALAQTAGEATVVAGIEARGFLAGLPVAQRLGLGFVPIRKVGKLPPPVASLTYDLEYGTDTLELQTNALRAEDKVMIVDDVLATGGTASAAVQLVQSTGAQVVAVSTILELAGLGGRDTLANGPGGTGYTVSTLWQVES